MADHPEVQGYGLVLAVAAYGTGQRSQRHDLGGFAAMHDGLPVLSFPSREDLRSWLEAEHDTSPGIWVRLFKKSSGVGGISFQELLDAGLCFGWSESLRHPHDDQSYRQRFTPRKREGTVSARNKAHIKRLVAEGLMTPAGLAVLRAEDLE